MNPCRRVIDPKERRAVNKPPKLNNLQVYADPLGRVRVVYEGGLGKPGQSYLYAPPDDYAEVQP